jgi:proteasome lid subunit RPN8/RPN11
MEAGVILDLKGRPIYWHNPENRSVAYLPDSVDLWEVFWKNKEKVSGFAHSHPGSGNLGPSWEDLTTFKAVELGLGKRLDWWIINEENICIVKFFSKDDFGIFHCKDKMDIEWVDKLRELSY